MKTKKKTRRQGGQSSQTPAGSGAGGSGNNSALNNSRNLRSRKNKKRLSNQFKSSKSNQTKKRRSLKKLVRNGAAARALANVTPKANGQLNIRDMPSTSAGTVVVMPQEVQQPNGAAFQKFGATPRKRLLRKRANKSRRSTPKGKNRSAKKTTERRNALIPGSRRWRETQNRRSLSQSPRKILNFSRGINNEEVQDVAGGDAKDAGKVNEESIEEGEIRGDSSDDDCVCIDKTPVVICLDEDSVSEIVQDRTLVPSQPLEEGELANVNTSTPVAPKAPSIQAMIDRSQFAQAICSTPMVQSNPLQRELFQNQVQAMYDTITSEENFSVEPYDPADSTEVIDITMVPSSQASQAKCESDADDSVIFVGEEICVDSYTSNRAPDFIPLVTSNGANINKQNQNPPKPKNLLPLPANNLFTRREHQNMAKYNTNTYNPNPATEATTQGKKRMVIIDGSNVAFGHGLSQQFSVKGLKICLEYFEKMGHEVKAVVPQFRLKKTCSSDSAELERLHREGKIVLTPCKSLPGGKSASSYDDRFILQIATASDAAIVSNDNYRDLIHENVGFKKIIENRVIGYTWCNDMFILPKDPYGRWGPSLSSILNRD